MLNQFEIYNKNVFIYTCYNFYKKISNNSKIKLNKSKKYAI